MLNVLNLCGAVSQMQWYADVNSTSTSPLLLRFLLSMWYRSVWWWPHTYMRIVFYIIVYFLHWFIRNNADPYENREQAIKRTFEWVTWLTKWEHILMVVLHCPSFFNCINWWGKASITNSSEFTALPLWLRSVCFYFLSFLPHFLFSWNKTIWFTLFFLLHTYRKVSPPVSPGDS